jgi:hypothetical protein
MTCVSAEAGAEGGAFDGKETGSGLPGSPRGTQALGASELGDEDGSESEASEALRFTLVVLLMEE